MELLLTEHWSLRQNQQAAPEPGCNTKAAFLTNKSTFHVGKQTATKIDELMVIRGKQSRFYLQEQQVNCKYFNVSLPICDLRS